MIFLSTIETYLPKSIQKFFNYLRANRPAAIKARKKGIDDFIRKVTDINNNGLKLLRQSGRLEILNGPFRGLLYLSESSGSALLPKIVGSYEEPIHHIIDQFISADNYDFIVDVGCAEGFYAVGFAKYSKKSHVIAYDINTQAISLAKQLASLNEVSHHLTFKSEFTVSELAQYVDLGKENINTLLFMDVEGAEINLLDPSINRYIPFLDILVELHDCYHPGCTELILDFLQTTHSCHVYQDYPWRSQHYFLPESASKSPHKHTFFDEFRPPGMRWLYAKRRPH